jgi:hypothetical protein
VEELVQLLELDWMEITSMSEEEPLELESIERTSIFDQKPWSKVHFEVRNN